MILERLRVLNKLYYDVLLKFIPGRNLAEEVLFQMESLLMDYLKEYPQDTEMWLKLTMIEFTSPWEDYERIEKYIGSILEYDKNNVQALLILAYAQRAYREGVSDEVFAGLQHCCDVVANKELLSMLYLAIAWYYDPWPSYSDEKKYELSLLQSIQCCNKYVKNYVYLAELYFKQGRGFEAKEMIYHALKNIRNVYRSDNYVSDITDVDRFFNEYFKGYSYTQAELENMLGVAVT